MDEAELKRRVQKLRADIKTHTEIATALRARGLKAASLNDQLTEALDEFAEIESTLLRRADDRIESGEIPGPKIRSTGEFAGIGVGQLRAWLASGGVVLFGTDVGYMNDYDPTDEYALMAEGGMSARQILASLTTAPAGQFGESTRLGRIAPGLAADLVVLAEDPSENARPFAGVRYTIRDGTVIYRSAK